MKKIYKTNKNILQIFFFCVEFFFNFFFQLVNCILNGNFLMELDEKFKLNKFEIQMTQLNKSKDGELK